MKKKLYLTILLLFFSLLVQAQNQKFSVKSFEPHPTDMTASSLEGKRIDQNNEVAALIKIVTTETGFNFEAGALGVVDSQQRTGEIWVWVPRASRKITIMHQNLGVLRDYRYPVEIQAERTYVMVLETEAPSMYAAEVKGQFLVFHLSPANATLEVNDSVWSVNDDGTSMNFVDFGTYTYRVRAQGYQGDVGIVKVDNPDKPKIVPVTLNLISQDIASGGAIDGTSQNASQPLPTAPPEGMLPGVFSVGQTKKVQFSRGNLQYKASSNTWRFAANQWDVYGKAYTDKSNDDWIDLFAWGTGNNPTLRGLSSKFSQFVDWGTNEIYGCVNRWHTLSCEEWEFVFNKRNTASGIRFAKAVVNGVNGVILLPDEWSKEVYKLNFTNDKNASYQGNAISASIWTDVFEPQGAVFLPAAGIGAPRKTFKMGEEGVYWSTTPKENYTYANYLQFDSSGLTSKGWSYGRGAGASVRLVCPAWD